MPLISKFTLLDAQEDLTSLKKSRVFLGKRTPTFPREVNRVPERANIWALCEYSDCRGEINDNSLSHKEDNKPAPVFVCAKQPIHQRHKRKSSDC